MLKLFLLRWAFNSVGLWLAAELIGGITFLGGAGTILIAGLIFSLVNAFIRPIIIVLSLPAIVLTLGIFTLFVNAFMLYLVTVLYEPFVVGSFGAAVLAVIIVWLVNYGLSTLLPGESAHE